MTDEELLAKQASDKLAEDKLAEENKEKKRKEAEDAIEAAKLKAIADAAVTKAEELEAKLKKMEEDNEADKLARMQDAEREKYIRDKAKDDEKKRKEAERLEAEEAKKSLDAEIAKLQLKAINADRRELANELGLPKELIKYVTGSDEESIRASILLVKQDFNLTEDVIKTMVDGKVADTFSSGGVQTQLGIGEAKLNILDFEKLSSNEKLDMMTNNKPLWDKYREIQKLYRGQ